MSDFPPSDIIEVEIDLGDDVEFELDLSDIVSEVSESISKSLPSFEPTCVPQAEPACVPQAEVEHGEAAFTLPAPQPTPPAATQPATQSTTQPATQPAQPAQPSVQFPSQPAARHAVEGALPPQFAELVARAKDVRLRSLAASTFLRIQKSLEALKAVENALTLRKVITVGDLFGGVRAQATALLAHLTETVVQGDGLDEEFREVLDGIRFVVAHEMGKVFSYEFQGLTADGPSSYTRAELTRAWGLLHNCMQQTAITLARTLDPEVTGQQLFDDYRDKTENSVTLYRELQLLLQKVRTAQKASGILLKHSLVRHLEHFREETMHFLMYKDWGEFGRYVDEVKRAFEEMDDFDCVLHGFAQYLSTLIHHVGMREVLSVREEQDPTAAPTRGAP